MASGIDMSARMISLAINIPIMGFILVEGVRASLRANLPVGTEMKALQSLAEKIAAGTVSTLPQEVSERLVHRALADGFGLVMVYAGIGVWLLAALSYLVFGRQRWRATSNRCPSFFRTAFCGLISPGRRQACHRHVRR